MDRDRQIVARVLARFAAVEDAKLKDLLNKVRKGATASFNWKTLSQVLEVMGGKVEKTIVAVPLFSDVSTHGEDTFANESQEMVEKKHAEFSKFLVSSVPSTPKVGQMYVTKIGPVSLANYGFWEFDFTAYMGNEAWRVSLETQTFLAKPNSYAMGSPRDGYKPRPGAKIHLYDALGWLSKETNWRERAEQLLELPPIETIPRTRDSTGSCGVCFDNVKIKPGNPPKLVLHGYRRPGTGQTHGSCFGVGYAPFELSVKATKEWADAIEVNLASAKKRLKAMEAGEIKTIQGNNGRDISEGDLGWEYQLKYATEVQARRIEGLEDDLKIYKTLVSKWKERPLPKEGDRHINWFFEGRK